MISTQQCRGVRLFVTFVISLGCNSIAEAKKPSGGGNSAPSYTIIKLDDAGGEFVAGHKDAASDINDLGNVVGTVRDVASGVDVAAFWAVDGANSQIVPLAVQASAYGLNHFNEIVGTGQTGGMYWPSPTSEPVALPPLADGLGTIAYGINDAGVICGYAREPVLDANDDPIGSTDVAVVWRVSYLNGQLQISGPIPLPTFEARSQAFAVNENDAHGLANVVGAFMTSSHGKTAAVQWTVRSETDGGLSVDFDPVALEFGDAAAFGVNNFGDGCGTLAVSGSWPQAQIWIGDAGASLDTGGNVQTTALDVNDAGVIVGSSSLPDDAIVWPSASSSPVLLTKFLPKRHAPFVRLWRATAINESGVIIGEGGDGVSNYGFVAIPK